jgi:hypothetical protein
MLTVGDYLGPPVIAPLTVVEVLNAVVGPPACEA